MTTTTETRTAANGRTAKIAQLNDAQRQTLTDTVLTAAIAELPRVQQDALLQAVAEFDRFDNGNDPYGEHDFGALTVAGERYFFKIDYYDSSLTQHSPDPSNASVTRRVLTIMHASDY